jgi:hypothetical protein
MTFFSFCRLTVLVTLAMFATVLTFVVADFASDGSR